MEYSILVRPDFFEQHVKRTEKDVKKTLKKQKYPDDVKLALYRQENFRRRMLKEKPTEIKVKATTTTPLPPAPVSSQATPTQPPSASSGEEIIISSLPKTYQKAGIHLIRHIQSIPDLKVNEKGEIEYKGETAEGSRIFDLIHDFIRKRNRPPARGYELLVKALRDSNTPRELITNPDRWLDIEYGGQTFSVTPKKRKGRRRQQSGSGLSKVLKGLKWKSC